jgi:hypothetical protein
MEARKNGAPSAVARSCMRLAKATHPRLQERNDPGIFTIRTTLSDQTTSIRRAAEAAPPPSALTHPGQIYHPRRGPNARPHDRLGGGERIQFTLRGTMDACNTQEKREPTKLTLSLHLKRGRWLAWPRPARPSFVASEYPELTAAEGVDQRGWGRCLRTSSTTDVEVKCRNRDSGKIPT